MGTNLQKIQAYFSGELEGEEAQEVQLFLAGHGDEPEVAAMMAELFDSCRAEGGDDAERALEATRTRLGLSRRPVRTALWIAAAAVAVLLAIPVSLKIGYRLHREPAPVAWNEITVPKAQTRSLTLPDGTVLMLNAGSRVTWPSSFADDKREVFLDGEVKASVAKDADRPFIIHSGDVDVRVHGTTFDLKSYREATMVEVVLVEGSVSLDIPSGDGRREVRLTPGDIAQYDRTAGGVTLGRAVPDGYKTFTDNRSFSFLNIPLKDIAADLERSFGTPIVVADEKAASRRFLAFFTNGEDLDEILALLSRNGDLRVTRSGGTVYLYGNK